MTITRNHRKYAILVPIIVVLPQGTVAPAPVGTYRIPGGLNKESELVANINVLPLVGAHVPQVPACRAPPVIHTAVPDFVPDVRDIGQSIRLLEERMNRSGGASGFSTHMMHTLSPLR